MAKIKVGTNFDLDMRGIDLGFVVTSSFFERTTRKFEGINHKFTGINLKYDADNKPVSGAFTGYAKYLHGKLEWSVGGASIDAGKLVAAARTKSMADDRKLIEKALSGNDTITGGNQSDVLLGHGGKDTIKGGMGDDRLHGGAGNDTLYGGDGNDKIKGGPGNDKLYGDHGKDKLDGGGGADTFYFTKLGDSVPGRADMIDDFSRKQGDRIHPKEIDANTTKSGNQDFKFIGTKKFDGKAGELRYEKKGGDTLVQGDIDGDGKADFLIKFDDSIKFEKGDFIL